MSNFHNPFLTSAVYQSCTQSRITYLDMLARLQMYGGQPIDLLRTLRTNQVGDLEKYREAAMIAAFAGDTATASTQLASIVLAWGLYKAYDDLIAVYGTYLDPADPDTFNDFVQAVQGKVVFWATELQNKWTEGETQRKNDLSAYYAKLHGQLNGMYVELTQEQRDALKQAHQTNQQYADTALKGVEQAQQGALWMRQGVETMHQQAAENARVMMQGVQNMYSHGENVMNAAAKTQQQFNEHMLQNLPREMEKAQAQTERRRILTRGIVALVLILAVPALFALAWFVLRITLHF